MRLMAKPIFDKATTIRTTPRGRKALGRIVGLLKTSDDLTWMGEPVTKEAILNATWLWMEEQGEEAMAEILRVYLPRLEAFVRGEDPGPIPLPTKDYAGGTIGVPDEEEPRRRRRRS